MIFVLIASILIPSQITIAHTNRVRDLASIHHDKRIVQARELLGKGYKKSIVSKSEDKKDLEDKLLEIVLKKLPNEYKSSSREIAHAIIVEATKRSLDPYFLAAVIAGESNFDPKAIGLVGEIGMMQIRPKTAQWVAEIHGIKWKGKKSLFDPFYNIKLGAAYLSWLREKFDNQGQLYLAAYNMGPKSVKLALARKIKPKEYSMHVMKRYIAFYGKI